MKLYGLKTGLGYYYVVAEHPTEAVDKFTNLMNESDYGYRSNRTVSQIDVIAESVTDKRFLTGKNLII